jgi:hypothetical protein
MSPPNTSDNKADSETQRKADRALLILYVAMAIFIIAPFVLYFLLK